MNAQTFKKCNNCGRSWNSRQEFLEDPETKLVGYQVNFAELEAGFFLFNHSCNSTLALEVSLFGDLHDGPVFQDRADGTEECPGHCLRPSDLGSCSVQCECNYVRDLMQILKAPSNCAGSA